VNVVCDFEPSRPVDNGIDPQVTVIPNMDLTSSVTSEYDPQLHERMVADAAVLQVGSFSNCHSAPDSDFGSNIRVRAHHSVITQPSLIVNCGPRSDTRASPDGDPPANRHAPTDMTSFAHCDSP